MKTVVRACIAAYVDDLLVCGNHNEPEYMKLREQIRDMYRWGEWQKGSFKMCGVRISQWTHFSFTLHQQIFVSEKLSLVDIPAGAERACTERNLST